jgi:hypothetical protein
MVCVAPGQDPPVSKNIALVETKKYRCVSPCSQIRLTLACKTVSGLFPLYNFPFLWISCEYDWSNFVCILLLVSWWKHQRWHCRRYWSVCWLHYANYFFVINSFECQEAMCFNFLTYVFACFSNLLQPAGVQLRPAVFRLKIFSAEELPQSKCSMTKNWINLVSISFLPCESVLGT